MGCICCEEGGGHIEQVQVYTQKPPCECCVEGVSAWSGVKGSDWEGGGELYGSGYPERREGMGCLVWGCQAQKKPPVFLPHAGAGGLSCDGAPERCPSHYNLPTSGYPTWAEG